jgi:protein gp37
MIKRYAGLKGWPEAPGEIKYFPERLEQPSKWTNPRRIFVCSMSDLFHEDLPWWIVHNVYNEISDNERHTFFVLTKRWDRMSYFLTHRIKDIPKNIWHGVSVTSQKDAFRIDALRTLEVNRFVSFEPLIGKEPLICDLSEIPWVIIGGESGPGARKMYLDVAKHLMDSVGDAAAVYFKQMGSHWANEKGSETAKGDDPTEWPSWARRREFPWET